MPNDLGFGEVELPDGCRLAIVKTPGILEPAITLSVQRLYGERWDTEAELVLGADAAQAMAEIVTSFVRPAPKIPINLGRRPEEVVPEPTPAPQSFLSSRDSPFVSALALPTMTEPTYALPARQPRAEPVATCPFCGGSEVELRNGETSVVPVVWWCRTCDRKVLPRLQATPPTFCAVCGTPITEAVSRFCVECAAAVRSSVPAPQRFWRVGQDTPRVYYQARVVVAAIVPSVVDACGPYRATRELAEADGRASGLPEWTGGKR